MKRREFIAVVGSAAITWPSVDARAQQTKMPRVVILAVDGVGPIRPFAEELRKLGYIEEKTFRSRFDRRKVVSHGWPN